MAWVRFEETPYFSRIFDLNVTQTKGQDHLGRQRGAFTALLAFEVDGIRFRIENGIALRQWRHLAFVYDPAGKVSIIVDGTLAFSKEIAFAVANTAWQTGYLAGVPGPPTACFTGAMAHFQGYRTRPSRPPK